MVVVVVVYLFVCLFICLFVSPPPQPAEEEEEKKGSLTHPIHVSVGSRVACWILSHQSRRASQHAKVIRRLDRIYTLQDTNTNTITHTNTHTHRERERERERETVSDIKKYIVAFVCVGGVFPILAVL